MSSEDGNVPDRAAPETARETAPASDASAPAESRIRAGLGTLDGLSSQPLSEHAPVYEALHEQLQSVLAEIDGA